MSIKVITFGCRVNSSEEQALLNHAEFLGLENSIIVNTCAVTKEAERQAKQTIRKLARENPSLKIFVTGCSAVLSPQDYLSIPNVHGLINKKDIINAVKKPPLKARAYVKVQDGCNNFCSFCIVPKTRGLSKSISSEIIINQIRAYINLGIKEIVLVGINITSWGAEFSKSLIDLIQQILIEIPDYFRLRISSIDPFNFDLKLLELLKNDIRLMPHFHISLQSGDNNILKKMKRKHTSESVIELCNQIKSVKQNAVIGADVIAGFPEETEEMFENTYKTIEKANISLLHVFKYSKRPGTLAYSFHQLPNQIIKKRADKLRLLSINLLQKCFSENVGLSNEVIIEKPTSGKTSNYLPITFEKPLKEGSIKIMKIIGFNENSLIGSHE